MKHPSRPRFYRLICAVCAVSVFVSALLSPAALAAEPESGALPDTLTAADAREMQQADQAVTALTESDAYEAMSEPERTDAALAQLYELAAQGLVQPRSIYVDEENRMVSFAYSCGVLGGILLEEPEEENTAQFRFSDTENLLPLSGSLGDGPGSIGSAMIYYAFDNTLNSTRYPYYAYMQAFWTTLGLTTRLNTSVTVSDLRRMGDYDLCILSAHGAYYTYSTGFFWKTLCTKPVILLTEKSSLYTDLLYGIDLLCQRIIKVNGRYCITPDFFRSSYWMGQLDGTVVYSETCEFFGVDGRVDPSMAEALLAGGARTVVGFVNNVYAVYSRSMLWAAVNYLIAGDTVQEAVQQAMDTYGTDDLVWYRAQGGKRPHAAAAYPLIFGQEDARLYELPAYTAAA